MYKFINILQEIGLKAYSVDSNYYIFYITKNDMESNIYLTIAISSILVFALIVATGIIPTAFVNILAQDGAIAPEGSVNDTLIINDTLIDKDKGTTRSSTEFSAVNDTISGQNTSQWTIQH
jgi:hypothetical protein